MSHPSINRWGLNLFWYKFWFNDKTSAAFNHQDKLLDKFILIYLHYGLLNFKHLLLSKYWYIKNKKFLHQYQTEVFTKYFRVVEYNNRVIQEKRTYRLRIKIKNLYHSRVWILRFQNWIIINFYSFQPYKKKSLSKKKNPKQLTAQLNLLNKNNFALLRYKLILSFFYTNVFLKKNYYTF